MEEQVLEGKPLFLPWNSPATRHAGLIFIFSAFEAFSGLLHELLVLHMFPISDQIHPIG